VSRRLTVNPVLSRELRQRVRSRRASVVLTVYLSLLVGAVGLMVWGIERSATSGSSLSQGAGQTVFGTLLFAILGLVCFIVPGVAAGAVAGERERLTLMPLQVTLLTPGQILRGKLLASLAFTTLLLVASLPLLAVAYVLGGVTVSQIAGGLFFVLATAAFLGVMSIWASTVLRRVQRATVVSYGIVGLLVVGTFIAYGVQFVATSHTNDQGNARWESLLLVAPNPFVVTADALGHDVDAVGASPFTPSQSLLQRRDERVRGGDGFEIDEETSFGVAVAPPPPFGGTGPVTTAFAQVMPEPTMSMMPTTTFDPRIQPMQPPPITAPPFGGMVVDPSSGMVGPPGGMVVEVDGDLRPGRDGGDFTDRGPIWAWTFGWWALLGGAAYLHAARKLRLPSTAGVRP
jgi:ABC-type transport system involved in multi-copper enzyme maturation permease subunit